ncbi:MAG: hypothetical protein MJB57_15155 [Gemmatimonadetes bacterium]|nr:hypothetical protein [Gemmatimonadota bacterium]
MKRTALRSHGWLLALGALTACAGQTSQTPETAATSTVEAAAPDFDPAPPPTDSVRVLFIGNSYTYVNELPKQIVRLAASADAARPMFVNQVTPGGATLERNWNDGRARRLIRLGGWTHVVLQEQSARPIDDPETFLEYARLFDREIDRVGAETVLYLTWAREHRPASQDTLTAAYRAVAAELGATVAPVGVAWTEALAEDPDLELHHEDRSHPGPLGSYLAASVFYATLYGATPEGLAAVPLTTLDVPDSEHAPSVYAPRPGRDGEAITGPTASLLQRVAWAVVGREATPEPTPPRSR